ncbi:MAG: DUF2384 domain-containing protein [Planctomycetes bacterium]|nr:DUF2384 domain-containing protein [Planctomycetota bacterium]
MTADRRAARAIENEPEAPAVPQTAEGRLYKRINDFIRIWVDPFRKLAPEALRVWEAKPAGYHGPFDRSEPAMLLFNDFFVHDYRVPGPGNGATVLELFRARHGMQLPHDERFLLEDWIATHLSVYEVRRVRTDPAAEAGVDVVDLLTGGRRFVHDVAASKGMVRFDVFLGRIKSSGGALTLSGAALFVPRELLPEFRRRLDRALAEFRDENPDASWPAFLKSEAAVVRQLLREVIDGIRSSVLAGGGRLAPSEALYDVLDSGKVETALGQSDDFKDAPGAPRGGRRFHWVASGQSVEGESSPGGKRPDAVLQSVWVSPDGKEKRIVEGEVRFAQGYLAASALSWDRLRRLREVLEARLGATIRYRRSTTREAVPSPAPPLAMPRIPARVEGQGLSVEAEKEVDRWLDQPQAALGGKTPRALCSDPDGKRIVEEALKDVENRERRASKTQHDAPFSASIRAKLGIVDETGG